MKLADSHAHLYDKKFNADRDDVINRAKETGIEFIIVPSEDIETGKKALLLSEKFSNFIFPAIGYHPHNTQKFNLQLLKKELFANKYVAIGEIGLDYYYNREYIEEQKDMLKYQLELSLELNLPVILHIRDAFDDIFKILDEYDNIPGVFHCFTGGKDEVFEALKRGFYISFSGIVTYKKSESLREAAAKVPKDRLLVETDSPYLSPVPQRGKRNEPSFITITLEKLAVIRNAELNHIAKITLLNTKKLFNLNL